MKNEQIVELRKQNPFLSANEVVLYLIRDDIVNCVLMPGERLKEEDLARILGVSRTPVREALVALNKEGFVQKVPRKGSVVSELATKDFLAMLEVRTVLEGFAARLTALRRTEDEVKEMEKVMVESMVAIKEQNRNKFILSDMKFHTLIFAATKNKYLIKQYEYLRNEIHRSRIYFTRSKNEYHSILHRHRKILDSIVNRDSEEAEKCATKHIAMVSEKWLLFQSVNQ